MIKVLVPVKERREIESMYIYLAKDNEDAQKIINKIKSSGLEHIQEYSRDVIRVGELLGVDNIKKDEIMIEVYEDAKYLHTITKDGELIYHKVAKSREEANECMMKVAEEICVNYNYESKIEFSIGENSYIAQITKMEEGGE